MINPPSEKGAVPKLSNEKQRWDHYHWPDYFIECHRLVQLHYTSIDGCWLGSANTRTRH
jgi:hypothetical protein